MAPAHIILRIGKAELRRPHEPFSALNDLDVDPRIYAKPLHDFVADGNVPLKVFPGITDEEIVFLFPFLPKIINFPYIRMLGRKSATSISRR